MHLAALAIYPLKGTQATDLPSAHVERRGLAHDRRWMLVDAQHRFVTQRTLPALATIRAAVTPEGLVCSAPGHAPWSVAVPPPTAPRQPVVIWNNTVDAVRVGPDADAWFSNALGCPLSLVYMDAQAVRTINPARALRPDDAVSFADGYPVLLTSLLSLDDLNARIESDGGSPVPMDRFRPNVVIDGAQAWAEDGWKRLRIGAVFFRNVKPCERCVVTTKDQQTGQGGKEPLRTLATFRKKDDAVLFGVNLIPETTGILHVGDAVDILE